MPEVWWCMNRDNLPPDCRCSLCHPQPVSSASYKGADVSEDSHVQPVAIKILNPIGFRLAPEDTLRRCVVARRGRLPSGYVQNGTTYSAKTAGGVLVGDQRGTGMGGLSSAPGVLGSGAETAGGSGAIGSASSRFSQNGSKHVLGPEHVWWLVSPNTKQVCVVMGSVRFTVPPPGWRGGSPARRESTFLGTHT